MVHPRFVDGRLTTNFIADEFPEGFNADLVVQDDPAVALVVVGSAVHQLYEERASLLSNQLEGHEHVAATEWVVVVGEHQSAVSVELTDSGYLVSLDHPSGSSDYQVETDWCLGEPLFERNDQRQHRSACKSRQPKRVIDCSTAAQRLMPVCSHLARPNSCAHMLIKEPADMSKFLLSPMPGLLVKLAVAVGQEVKEGEELAVVEAMKMENSLRATQDGVVAKQLGRY